MDLLDAVQMYVDEIKSRASELQVKGGLVEHKVEIVADCWGTVDAALWNLDQLIVADAKFGKGVIVEADMNSQELIYAIGMLKKLKAEGISIPPETVLMIIQPRTVDPVREYIMKTSEVQQWANDVLAPAITRLRNKEVEFSAGDHCKWCPIAGCEERSKEGIELAEEAFAPFTGVDKPALEGLFETDTGGSPAEDGTQGVLDIAAEAKLAQSFPFINEWMDGITERLKTAALDGQVIPHFKLVTGRGSRKLKTEEDVFVKAMEEHDVDPYEKNLKTIPAIEKEVGKKKAKEIGLADHTLKVKGSPTLVPDTDKRPAVSVSVEEDFKEFVESSQDAAVEPGEDTMLVLGDDDPEEMSLMDQLTQGVDDADSTEEELVEESTEEVAAQEAPEIPETPEAAEAGEIKERVAPVSGRTATPPSAPKRRKVFNLIISGGATISSLAKSIGITENSVMMHIRYLNERDGYGYNLYEDGRIEITQ